LPALGVLGRPNPPTAQPPLVATERPKQKTGTGLGPVRPISGPTLLSAAEAARNAQVAVESGLPLVTPEPPPLAPAVAEESVAFQVGDADIEIVAAPPPPPPPPPAAGMRPLAQPMAFTPPQELDERDLEVPEIPDDEPTKVGTPSPAELERARAEGLALLFEQQAAQKRAAVAPPPPPITAPLPPPPPFQATSPGHGFGTLNLDVRAASPAAPAAPVAPPIPQLTLPLAPAGVITQRLASSSPPPFMPVAPVLVDVTPLTLAVETVEGFCDSIIGRNTTVPCSRTREFVTAADNQTSVRVRVSQGESKRFGDNTLLGEIELSGLRPARRGDVRIAVSFALDASGMLVVSAKDVGTGRETSTQVRLVGLPDAAEVARMAERQVGRGV